MSRRVAAITFIPLVAILGLVIMRAKHGPWSLGRVAGLIITLLSLGLLTKARFDLGDSFSVSAQAKHLVTSGIYSRVRHPVYVFGCLLFVGVALYFEVPLLLVVLIILIPIQIIRARREQRVLEAAFGDDYRRYRSRTWL